MDNIKKTTKTGCGLILLIVILVVGYAAIFNDKPQTRQQAIENQFSPFDGSHVKLTAFIKEKMDEPDSYKNINTTYQDQKDYITVAQSFFANDEDGTRHKHYVRAMVDTAGNVLKILESK